jgi:hypothetical protein
MTEQPTIFDLTPYGVPREAIAIMFGWEIKPPEARVLLFRTPDDTEPKILAGQGTNGHIGLVEPQTLYIKTECPTDSPTYPYIQINLRVMGHETLEG